jgi:multidrug resistance protein, MATE family
VATNPPSVREELSALVRLSWPIMVAQLGVMTMGLVDTAVLGRVSAVELAGAAIGRSVGFAAVAPSMGIAMALEPLASQAVGAGEHGRAWAALQATLRGILVVTAPLIAISLGIVWSLERFGVDPEVASRARSYTLTQSPGMVLAMMYLAHKTFLQANEKTRPALVGAIVANLINLVVCNLLVRGDDFLSGMGLPPLGLPRMGAFGAGIAFSIANAVLLAVVARASGFFRPMQASEPIAVRSVARLGLPVGLQLLAEIGVFSLGTVLVGRFGSVAVSAHQVALGLASFTFMGGVGFSGGTAVRVGYAVGEGRSPRRAGLLGIGCGAGFMLACGVVFATIPAPLVKLFTRDPDVVSLGVRLMVVVAAFQLFDGLQVVSGGALRGAGDVRFPFIATVLAHWAVGFPLAIVFGFVLHGGVLGIWWGLFSGLVAVAALLVLRFVWRSRGVLTRV